MEHTEELNNNSISDSELIKAYLDGNEEAFEVLYERYKRQIYSYLNRLFGAQFNTQVDDIFQQTWLRIIDKLPKYECRQMFLAWSFRIAHNLAIDYFRKVGRMGEVVSDENLHLIKTDKEPWLAMDHAELKKVIDQAVGELGVELREVFLLRQEKVSFKDIAEIQGCSINTVLGRMQYALKNLQKFIQKTEYGRGVT